MYNLTAADFADTGQWRLLLKIGEHGLEAFLENTLHPEIEPQQLCSVKWDAKRDDLCREIEEAVYNNPRLLDDFATRIILYDPRTLFVPTQIAEESAGAEAELYNKVYIAEESDVMTDRDSDITAVWSLAPGVKGFLMRSFPGARITCNLMEKVRELRKTNNRLTVYADIREDETDFIFLNGKELMSASTHSLPQEEIRPFIMNLLDVYGYKPEDAEVVIR
ncbi:MAG: DUF3822 family protein [Muribaculaceae bacterium]|nr:DUF3822 family protein [Muribaculaceae bacterium]